MNKTLSYAENILILGEPIAIIPKNTNTGRKN